MTDSANGIIDSDERQTLANDRLWGMTDCAEWHTVGNDRLWGTTDTGEWQTVGNESDKLRQWEWQIVVNDGKLWTTDNEERQPLMWNYGKLIWPRVTESIIEIHVVNAWQNIHRDGRKWGMSVTEEWHKGEWW